jgi:N-acetylglutamate synthase-like GNAT family acetyltransferase
MQPEPIKVKFTISNDISTFDHALIHEFLTHSDCAKGISLERVQRRIENSLCFGVFVETQQIGFARVITDFDSFVYLADVFMVTQYRKLGLTKRLIKVILAYPSLQNLRRWLVTSEIADGFYAQLGFVPLAQPMRWMENYNATRSLDLTKKSYEPNLFSPKTTEPTMKLGFKVSTNKSMFNRFTVHQVLTNSYWAKGISLERVQKRIENTLCFGVFADEEQVGFARVITDFDSFAYLADVFILEGYQKIGLSKRLIAVILECPPLQQVQRWVLATKDAHGLYAKLGFTPLENPSHWMEIYNPTALKAD